MSSQGVELTQHYVQQVCTPTRGALMSGRYPIHTGLQHDVIYPGHPWGLPLDEVIIPQILKEYNYSTHAVGKWHLGMHRYSFTPLQRGFDDFFGYYLGAQNYNTHVNGGGYDLRNNYRNKRGILVDEVRKDFDGQYSTELYAKYVIDLLHKKKQKDDGTPFFLYMAFQNVHAPHMVPQYYIDKYSTDIKDKKEKIFAAMVSAMDEAIGNITDVLKTLQFDKNTIIVFSSDNGGNVNCVGEVTSSNYPYRGGKRAMYEGGVRSPSFVWAPGHLDSGKSNEMIHVTDWLPTFWRLGSLNGKLKPNHPIVTKPLDGFDQWDTISQHKASPRTEFVINIDLEPVGCGHQVPTWAIRWNDWKLIIGDGGPPSGWYPAPNLADTCNKPKESFIELYNIKEDPYEHMNISHLKPDIVRALTQKLMEYNNTMVEPNNKAHDPNSSPTNFDHIWVPWLDFKDGKPFVSGVKYIVKEPKTSSSESLQGDEPLSEEYYGKNLMKVQKNIWLQGNQLDEEDLQSEKCWKDNWVGDIVF